ncbi:MAG: hypothetical protein AAGJ84_02085 [Pseudomonadota bacterium]
MSHAYPIARNALAALTEADRAARTRYDAEAAIDDAHIDALETEWLTPDAADIETWLSLAAQSPGHGFVQQYEDAAGRPVFAITYWKLSESTGSEPKALPPDPVPTGVAAEPEEDETDDLYFKHKKKTRSGRKPPADKNQLDLFGTPKPDEA